MASNEDDTLLGGKVETPKRALALKLGLAVCGLTALVAALATEPSILSALIFKVRSPAPAASS